MKYKVGDLFIHKDKKIGLEIVETSIPNTKYRKVNTSNSVLYDLRVIGTGENKRYWEEKVEEVLIKVDSKETLESLYG